MDALLNWLWQGTVVALASGVILAALRTASAATRYGLCCMALLLVVALPVIGVVSGPAPVERVLEPGNAAGESIVPVIALPATVTLAPAFTLFWTLWAAILGGRAAVDLIRVHRVKRTCRPLPHGREGRLAHWSARTSRRVTQLVVSDGIPSAALVGVRSPVIAVSPMLLDWLDDAELDLIVMHEWAHLERRDEIANIVQLFVRVAAGWHPGVWWLDRRLHAEREAACDERTVAVTGSARAYAACLVKLAAMRTPSPASLPVPAALSSSRIGDRIGRLLHAPKSTAPLRSAARTLAAVTALAAAAVTVGRVQLVATLPSIPIAGDAGLSRKLRLETPRASTPQERIRGRDGSSPAPERPNDRTTERPNARTTERPNARTTERPDDRTTEPARDRSVRRLRATSPPLAETGPPVRSQAARPAPIPVAAVFEARLPAGTSGPLMLPPASDTETTLPRTRPADERVLPSIPARQPGNAVGPPAPWVAVADAGAAVGNASQQAAGTTARFFTKLSRQIAGAF